MRFHWRTTVSRLGVHEVIVAVREQRGGLLPLSQLLNCRLRGIRVTDLSGFFERMTGQVPDRLAEGELADLRRRLPSRPFSSLRQASVRHSRGHDAAGGCVSGDDRHRDRGADRKRPTDHLPPGDASGSEAAYSRLLKFRSMGTDAEHDGVPRWASMSDPRVTKVGQFIRRTRIDELPQLINVLKGEMSFVGPRPERPYFVAQLSEKVPFYGARHTVKPGVTGWAQVHYSYGASVEDAAQKLQFDLYYVKNHTLLLDLVILVRTMKVVLLRQGAR